MSFTRSGKKNYRALAVDGDGTLTRAGHLGEATRHALLSWHKSGRKIFLTTGETLKELAHFPHLGLFDLVIAENGGLLYDPATKNQRLLASPPPAKLIRALRRAHVHPLKRGRVIIATDYSQERAVSKVLAKLGLPGWHIVRNRRQMMVLPEGVNKASGLAAVLPKVGLMKREVVAIGDAENDIALIEACGCGVAVANAVRALKEHARFVTTKGMGSGVVEMIDQLMLSVPKKSHLCKTSNCDLARVFA